MTHDCWWCCQTIFRRPDIARVTQLLEDGELLRVVARRLCPRAQSADYGEVTRSLESGEYTRRQGQGRSWARPLQDRFLILLSRRNHTSTAKTLENDFCRATEVHLPDQMVRYRLHYDVMRARRPVQGPVLTAQHRSVRFNFARQHQNWQIRHWMPILFADESRFTVSTNDRRARVWRRLGERYSNCNIVGVDRCDGGSSWSGPRYPWMVIQTCVCFLELV